ncbi:MAG TPA: hypothetical protein VNK43_02825 [Gemmatimonadales bacterium]|nr:hypothetical protein [Gemmatimonadales bacterium]
MLTPETLFARPSRADDEPLSHAPFLERARLERERGQEAAAQVALGAYLVARLVDRALSAGTDPETLEGLRWQLQSTRRFVGELPEDEVEATHLAGIVDAVATPPPNRDAVLRMSLVAYAYYLEQEGRLEEALETLAGAARTYGGPIPPHDYPALALFSARLHRVLARWEEASAIYRAAGEAAARTGDDRSVLLSRLGRANVLRGQGNLPAARAEVERVIADASAPEYADVRARAYSDLAAVLDRQGAAHEAIGAAYRAFLLYRDPVERWRALTDLAVLLKDVGAYQAAARAFELVLARSETFSVRTNAVIESMDLHAATGNEMAFRRLRNEAEAVLDRMPPSMAVDFRYKLGIGLLRFDRAAAARRALEEAQALAERHRLNEWYFRIERTLRRLSERGVPETPEPPPAGAEAAPAIAEVFAGLERYATAPALG